MKNQKETCEFPAHEEVEVQVIGKAVDSTSGSSLTMYNNGLMTVDIKSAYRKVKEGKENKYLTVFSGSVGVRGYKAMITIYGDAETIKAIRDGEFTLSSKPVKEDTNNTDKVLVQL
jgi:hypothetical protein